jgi:voltage-gated potassium channel
MLSNQYTDDFPDSLVGKLTIIFTMIAGMGFFAVVIGAVSAIMIDKFKEGIIMKRANLELLEEHIIICGWQERTPQIITELHRCEKYRRTNIVVISHARDFVNLDLDKYGVDASRVYLLEGDFTDPEILKKANIHTASIAIILPYWSEGRTRRDVDARTVLAALTIEKLNGDVYSCAELLDQEYESHMEIGNVNEVIIGGYYNGLIMAHAAINQDLVPFIKEILPAQAEHKLGNISMSDEFIGKKFEDAVQGMMASRKILPVGIRTEDGNLLLNPYGRVLQKSDYFVAIFNKKDKSSDC